MSLLRSLDMLLMTVFKFELPILWSVSLCGRHAEVVTRVAGSLEAGGLPRHPESLVVEINVMKS